MLLCQGKQNKNNYKSKRRPEASMPIVYISNITKIKLTKIFFIRIMATTLLSSCLPRLCVLASVPEVYRPGRYPKAFPGPLPILSWAQAFCPAAQAKSPPGSITQHQYAAANSRPPAGRGPIRRTLRDRSRTEQAPQKRDYHRAEIFSRGTCFARLRPVCASSRSCPLSPLFFRSARIRCREAERLYRAGKALIFFFFSFSFR